MATNTAKRPEFLEKMMASSPRHEPEVEEAQNALKEARLAIPTPMLDIVFRNGKVRSFSYAYLAEVEFDPGDTLTLKFTGGATVIAEGRGLARYRQSVRLHRLDELRDVRLVRAQRVRRHVPVVAQELPELARGVLERGHI